MSNPIVHFELPADDSARASAFYKEVFGWDIVPVPEMKYTILRGAEVDKENMYTEKGQINGGMFDRSDDLQHPIVTIDVKDIDASLEAIQQHRGSIIREKTSVGDMGWIAYFKDSENNVVGLWQNA